MYGTLAEWFCCSLVCFSRYQSFFLFLFLYHILQVVLYGAAPSVDSSPACVVFCRLFTGLVQEALNSYSYHAEVAGSYCLC